ncbi:CPBP family intramembrane metalloprotease [Halobacillus sp. ACCC02827]|uniref:CPBP family intramembrane glutamic endopeptidase n=1 Tax=Bacillaceae TaxID=186817 RepID=UPI0002A4DEE4|nr:MULTISPECIES: CPBP family intramembrane glutamic endopeptidase [Bacillaceae]ELK45371.1 hypothetical protein D479_15522 [Halobacillus sp. BAB-2008]QHT46902.1 CPBP family intramembrane metalloprotease [Bacillus sp. SB49]WJE14124.1 CPBP family intramembrane metalloprotease [Halobacillus sp. ACCC02827]
MNRKSQAEIIHEMSDREVTVQLVFTQLVLLLLALAGSFFLFDSFQAEWRKLFYVELHTWVYFGIIPGLLILLIDFILMYSLPEKMYDDGGINVKVFQTRSVAGIVALTLLIAISEELLFRGVLHTQFGYIIASVLFALMHIRYWNKIVLLLSVLFVSFLLGYMFEWTGSITVTITAHFIIDLILALSIRFGKWGGGSE